MLGKIYWNYQNILLLKRELSLQLNFASGEENRDWNKSIYAIKNMKTVNPWASSFEVNYRAIYERNLKRIYCINFCGFVNVPPAINVKPFNDMHNKITSTYTDVEDASTKNAANEFIVVEGDSAEGKIDAITI